MKKCDLVMKGGITSGIVYPRAVLELSREYRFANIGGTSAGAIAAAVTAAAELRRQRDGSSAGFETIGRLPSWMGENVDGRSRLVGLFEPSGAAGPLLEAALAYVEAKGSRVQALLRAILRAFPRFGSITACIGFVLVLIAAMAAAGAWGQSRVVGISMLLVIVALVAVTLAATLLASIVEALLVAVRTLPAQGYGICSGMKLTEWLAQEIDSVAGVTEKPVTFGDLRAAKIHLEVMTTNLTHGRPHRLPLESRHYSFDAAEMRRLFPERIVQWMIDHAEEPKKGELHPLPIEELPIVVAARMSLSFPILLSAVPLWAVDHGRRAATGTPERCWFSDGGITSNFPVHFFDAPLPRWPTFAINLAPRTARYHAPGQRTYMPRGNVGGLLEWWEPFDTLAGFVTAIVGTMQNWRDNMLLRLPGQRDRIAHVLLAPDEGGLNLSMDPATIEDMAKRGAEAGRLFRERFDWRNHQWVRYLSFMSAFEDALEGWERGFDEELVGGTEPLPSYKISAEQRMAVKNTSLAFLQHVRENFRSRTFRGLAKRPRPMPLIRAMPRE
jgi:predicted acylesterase/phospholipase RssA